jgi:acyl-coenzyme A thioesterase PaaI-like protein
MSTLVTTRAHAHPVCRLCGPKPAGLPVLNFSSEAAGMVQADFICQAPSEGYQGWLHGGLAAAILDAAMTNALFSQGTVAVTARLELRYRQPVNLGQTSRVEARVQSIRGGAWQLHGSISQQAGACVEAEALFLPPPGATT